MKLTRRHIRGIPFWLVILLLAALVVVQFFYGIVVLMLSQGDLVLTFLPVLVTASVFLICRKRPFFRWSGILLAAATLLGCLPDGFLSFGRVSFREMPVQRYEYHSPQDLIQGPVFSPAEYRNDLGEAVLVRNAPQDSLELRDLMIRYFDEKTRGEEQIFYTRRTIRFYIDARATRVFIRNVQDPYNFARVELGDDPDYNLGWVNVARGEDMRRIKTVRYRTRFEKDHGPMMRTDTLPL